MATLNTMFYRLLSALILIACLFLNACVTTETGGIGEKADQQKALEYSVQLARSYIRSGQWEDAKRHLRKAIEIDDSSAEVFEAMALVFQNTGEIELAEENYKRSIKLDGSISRVKNNYAAFLYQQRRYKQAAKQLEIVVADTLYENRASAFVNLGRSYVQMGELYKGKDALQRAYMMNQRNVALMFELADVYFRLNDYVNAQRFYDGYRAQVKKQPAQALWLGIRLADKFRNKNAFSSYSLALKNLYPNSEQMLEYIRVYGGS